MPFLFGVLLVLFNSLISRAIAWIYHHSFFTILCNRMRLLEEWWFFDHLFFVANWRKVIYLTAAGAIP